MRPLRERIRSLLRRVIRVTFGRRTLTIRGEGGHLLTFSPAEYPSLLKGVRAFEPEHRHEWGRLLQPDEAILDIGANIGLTVQLFVSLLSGRCSVIAFEPSQRNFALLEKNVSHLRPATVVTVQAAVCDHDGEVEFSDNVEHGGLSRLTSLDANKDEAREMLWTRTAVTRVRAVQLDRFLATDHKDFAPSFVKIDVEGAAGDVLAGAEAMLAKHHPLIHCSFHSALEANAVLRALQRHGYQGLRFSGARLDRCTMAESSGHFVHPADPRLTRLGLQADTTARSG